MWRAPLVPPFSQFGKAMPPGNKRERDDSEGDEERARRAKERRIDIIVNKVATELNTGFCKLHSTKTILGQAKANLEMVGGLVCRQKDELKQVISRLHAARRGTGNTCLLTVVAEAAHQKYERAMYDQIKELSEVEEALAQAHTVLSADNERRSGPWPALPPIRARAATEPKGRGKG